MGRHKQDLKQGAMKHRFAFFLCVLLVGEEFAKAKSVIEEFNAINIGFNDDSYEDFESQVHGSFTEDDDSEAIERLSLFEKEVPDAHSKRMHLVKQHTVDECTGKKRWSIGPVFKIFSMFGKFMKYGGLLLNVGTGIYSAIRGCKDIAPDAERLVKAYEAENPKIKRLSKEADDLQFESLLERNYIEDTTVMYSKILCKLNEIDRDSETMLLSISPEVRIATENATRQIELLIERKNDTLEGINYLDVDKLYRSNLQHALGIGIPALLLALPAGYSLFKTARKRYRQRRVADIEANNNVDLKLPSKSRFPKLFRKTRFGRWIGRVQARFTIRIQGLKDKFNKFFGRISSIVNRGFKVLKSAASIAVSAYFAYKAIADLFDQCNTLRAKAKEAYDRSIEAVKQINQTLVDIREYRKEIAQSWKEMRDEITKDEFLQSVKETMTTMQNAANQSEPMKAVAREIGQFLDIIKTTDNTNVTYNASRDLYNALIKVPFAYVCYKQKINVINYVVKRCLAGGQDLKEIIAEQRIIFNEYDGPDDSDPRRCKDDLGIDYLPDHSLVQTWLGTAQQNGYHPICFMNSKQKRESICDKYKQKGWNASRIAKFHKFDEAKVQEILDLLQDSLSERQQSMICKQRHKMTPEEIQDKFKEFNFTISVEQIKAVQCNEANEYDCVPFEKLVKEAWKKTPIKLPEAPDE